MGGTGKLINVPRRYFLALASAFALQLLFWSQTRHFAPPVTRTDAAPSPVMARIAGLGDGQFYYRAAGLGLQTMGDWAGQLTPLERYDYGRLAGWFSLLSQLDPRSHYVPSLAAYYYGLSRNPAQVRLVIGYLRRIGLENPQQNWNYLAYAVYLARHRVKDPLLALEMAQELAALKAEGLPAWTRQLPAFVLADAGELEAARTILEAILASTPNLDPAEQYFIRDYIARRLAIAEEPE